MDTPLNEEDNAQYFVKLTALRHDIRNQLSNIQLAVQELKYELPEPSDDVAFYLETIAASCKKISTIIKEKEQE